MGHIFISYSHKDSSYVHKLVNALEEEGFEVWIDDRIHYGSEWPRVVTRNLDVSDGVIVVLSNSSFESDMVQNEITRAIEKKKPIFPLLLEGDNWLIVQAKQFVDVRDESVPTEKFYKRLEEITQRKNMKAEREAAEKAAREKAEKDAAEKAKQEIVERPKPSKTNSPRRANVPIIVALIGLVGMIVLISSPLLENLFSRTVEPTTLASTKTETNLPMTSRTPTKADIPTITMTSIVGEWQLNYAWKCSGSPYSATLILKEDGTLSSSDEYTNITGTWKLQGENITLIVFRVTYTGKVAGSNMSGTMEGDDGYPGCWNAQRK